MNTAPFGPGQPGPRSRAFGAAGRRPALRRPWAIGVVLAVIVSGWCDGASATAPALTGVRLVVPAADDEPPEWRDLFNGRDLEGWESSRFGGEGEIAVEEGVMILEMGSTLTGVTYQGELPAAPYEIELEASQLQGIDFFCGLTFPVGQSHCSFIVGGWGGSVVGLSSIDGLDASENDTTEYMTFEPNRWYRIRVRVTNDRIGCWIDDELVVDQSIEGRAISIRPEVNLSRPLGIAAWQTKAGLRAIRIRSLSE